MGSTRIIGDDVGCSMSLTATIRVNGPSHRTADGPLIKKTSNAVCGDGGCSDRSVDAEGNSNGGVIPTAAVLRERGDYVPPNYNRCTVVTVGGGTMSWCGTLTDADGNAVAPNYGVALSDSRLRRQ